MEIENALNYRDSIVTLLSSEKLPVEDLPPILENFLAATEGNELTGVIGLEIYGDYGLLRSLAVKPAFRNQNIAGRLIAQIEIFAASRGLKVIFLLSETAPDYFARKGYQKITRSEVPAEVQRSTEFSHVCPHSAIVMKKDITKNILILCTGNSCRSQIAEGYLRHFAGDKVNIYSAGIETHGVNPKAIQVMAEDHIDISMHTSNNVDEYINVPFDYVITVCDNAKENCPYLPGNFKRFHYNFPDPAKAQGTPEEIMNEFRRVRDMIKVYSKDFVTEHLPA